MNEKIKIGEFIYLLRREKGLSQTELGDMVNVSNRAVSKWETGESNPELSIVPRLASILGVTTDELLAGKRCEEAKKDESSETESGRFFKTAGTFIQTESKYEFISKRRNRKGEPFLHINFGREKDGRQCRAKGTIAVGSQAHGTLAIGIFSRGLISLGIFSLGLISAGFFSLGLLSAGLVAVGILAAAGIAFGGVAVGGIAAGIIAVGGVAAGIVAVGGLAAGYHVYTSLDGVAWGKYIHITDSLMHYRTLFFAPLNKIVPLF